MWDLGCPKFTVGQCVSRVWNVCLGRCGPDGGSPWGETDQAWDEGGRGQWVRVLCCGQRQGSVFREAGDGRETEPSDLQRDQAPHAAVLGWHGFPLKETLDLQRHNFRCHAEGGYVADIYRVVARNTATYATVHRMAPQHPSQKKDRSSLRHHSCAETQPEIITLREMGKWKECLWTNKWNWDVNQWSGYENNRLAVPRGRGKVVFKVELW